MWALCNKKYIPGAYKVGCHAYYFLLLKLQLENNVKAHNCKINCGIVQACHLLQHIKDGTDK